MNPDLRSKMLHALAALVGIAVFAVIFIYTAGDGLWLAAQCGIATALIIYFWSRLNDPGVADEDI